MSARGWAALALLGLAACGNRGEPVIARERGLVDVAVRVERPATNALDMEREITIPIERALTTSVTGVRGLHARSVRGRAEIVVELTADHALDATMAVNEAVSRELDALPVGVLPEVRRLAEDSAVLRFTVTGDASLIAITAWVDHVYEELLRLPGVGRVALCGDTRARSIIDIDPQALAARGGTLDDVRDDLLGDLARSANLTLRTRSMNLAERRHELRLTNQVATIEDTASPRTCFPLDGEGHAIVAATVYANAIAPDVDRLAVRTAVERRLHELERELAASWRLRVLPRTRPVALELVLDRGESPPRRLARLAAVLAELRGATTAMLAELGGRDDDLGAADVRLVPGSGGAAEALADAARFAFARHGLRVRSRDDRIVRLIGTDPRALQAQLVALHARLAASPALLVIEDLGGERAGAPELARIPDVRALDRAALDDAAGVLEPEGQELYGFSGDVRLRVAGPLEAALALVAIRGPDHGAVPLARCFTIDRAPRPDEILRDGGSRWVGVRVAGPLDALEDALAELPVPAGIRRELHAPD